MRERAITKEIENRLSEIRETRDANGGADRIAKDVDTLLEVVIDAVAALNVRYRHYGPDGELRVEPDEWVKAEDVLMAIFAVLQSGLLRDIFSGAKLEE